MRTIWIMFFSVSSSSIIKRYQFLYCFIMFLYLISTFSRILFLLVSYAYGSLQSVDYIFFFIISTQSNIINFFSKNTWYASLLSLCYDFSIKTFSFKNILSIFLLWLELLWVSNYRVTSCKLRITSYYLFYELRVTFYIPVTNYYLLQPLRVTFYIQSRVTISWKSCELPFTYKLGVNTYWKNYELVFMPKLRVTIYSMSYELNLSYELRVTIIA